MARRFAVAFVRTLLRLFFRRIEVTGIDNVPATGGGLVVSWHPNALVDAALILVSFPRPIVFGARHGLFTWPVLGQLLRALGTVPIYRRRDTPGRGDDARRKQNDDSLDALADALADGSYACLFPEGDSHDQPAPTALRTGAARLYYRARTRTPPHVPVPAIVPIGLHYDEKRLFGSRALIAIHPPLDDGSLLAAPDPDDADELRDKIRTLTDELESTLHTVVHATESWKHHHALQRIRKLMRAERAHRAGVSLARPDMRERVLAFQRLVEGYNQRAVTHPDRVRELLERTLEYDSELSELGIRDHELDQPPALVSPWLAMILVLQAALVYLVLPPILVIGAIVNFPAAATVYAMTRAAARKQKDEASLKLVAGSIVFPITWLVTAVLVSWGWTSLSTLYPRIPSSPALTGVAAFLLSALSAYVVLNYERFARQTLRAIRVRLTRHRRLEALDRLRAERSYLQDAFVELGEGLELPGHVSSEGRIVDRE